MANKPNKRGRSKGGFVMVIHPLMESPAWRAASGVGIKLLLQLMRLSKGNNGFGDEKHDRGQLYLSERHAAKLIGVSKNTAAKAFAELEELGFIRLMTKGAFDVKGLATTWRLTFQPYPRANMAPTNEWREWQPEKKPQAQKLTGIGSKTDRPHVPHPPLGSISKPIRPECADPVGSITAPHIDIPRQGAVGRTSPKVNLGPEIPGGDFSASLAATFDEAIATVWGISRRNSDGTCDNHPDPASLKAEMRDPRFLRANGTTAAEWMMRLFPAYLDDCDDDERAVLDRAIGALATLTMTGEAA